MWVFLTILGFSPALILAAVTSLIHQDIDIHDYEEDEPV
jgi:hypothetical protein